MSAARHERLEVAGATLALWTVGSPEAPPLVVVHGGPGESHGVLRPWLDGLGSERRRIVYYDQRGCGASPLAEGAAPAGYLEHVADLERLRAHLGEASLDVMGFSWGATLTVAHGLAHPDGLGRMVLVSPPPHLSEPDDALGARIAEAAARPSVRAVLSELERRARNGEDEPLARFARRVAPVLSDPSRVSHLTPVEQNEAAVEAVARSMRDVDLRSELTRLRGRVRSLVVAGADDPISAASAPRLAERIGASSEVLASSGHAPFAEAPEAFLRVVGAFLDLAPRPPS